VDKISGDDEGIATLRELVQQNKDFFRFLIEEAKTAVDQTASFAGKDGTKFVLKLDLATGQLTVLRP
jgi:hypothetical protein